MEKNARRSAEIDLGHRRVDQAFLLIETNGFFGQTASRGGLFDLHWRLLSGDGAVNVSVDSSDIFPLS